MLTFLPIFFFFLFHLQELLYLLYWLLRVEVTFNCDPNDIVFVRPQSEPIVHQEPKVAPVSIGEKDLTALLDQLLALVEHDKIGI
jgi:hypothetical protein